MSSFDYIDVYSEKSLDELTWLGTPIGSLMANRVLNTTGGTYHYKAPALCFTSGTSLMTLIANKQFYLATTTASEKTWSTDEERDALFQKEVDAFDWANASEEEAAKMKEYLNNKYYGE